MLSSFVTVVAKSNKSSVDDNIRIVTNKKPKKSKTKTKTKAADVSELDFSKFTPIKQEKCTVSGYESDDNVEGTFSSVTYKDDRPSENDLYKRQDAEWEQVMKDADHEEYDDDTNSSVAETDSESFSTFDEMLSEHGDEDSYSEDMSFDDYEDEVVVEDIDISCRRKNKEPKIKEPKVFKGISLFKDDDWIP